MADLSTLTARRDALEQNLASGVLELEYPDGSRVRFASIPLMRSALADVKDQIAAFQGNGPLREIRIKSSKGLV